MQDMQNHKKNATHLSIKGGDVNNDLSNNLFETKLKKLELITDGFFVENDLLERFIKKRDPDILITDNLCALNWGEYKEIEVIIKYPNNVQRIKKLECKKLKVVIKGYNFEDIKQVFKNINIKGLDDIELVFPIEDEIYEESSDDDSDYKFLREFKQSEDLFGNNEEQHDVMPVDDVVDDEDDEDDNNSIPDTLEPDQDYNPEMGDITNNEVLDFNTLDVEETPVEQETPIEQEMSDLFDFEIPKSVVRNKLFDDENFEDDNKIKVMGEEEEDEGEEENEDESEYYNFKMNIEKDLEDTEKQVFLFLKKILHSSRAKRIKLNSSIIITFPFFKENKRIETLEIVYNIGFLNLFKATADNLHLIDIYQDLIIEDKNLLNCIFNSKYKNLIIKTKENINETTFQILKEHLQTLDTDRLEIGYIGDIHHFKILYKLPIVNPNIKELILLYKGNKIEFMNRTEMEREYFKNNKKVYFKLL